MASPLPLSRPAAGKVFLETGTPRRDEAPRPPHGGAAAVEEVLDVADAGPKLLRGLLEVFILESLEQAPKHGYALLKELTETFGAEPNRNRLYPLLGRLVRDGYIREVSESGGNRTLYGLTDEGREALRAYRRLPAQFRHALRRIWSVDVHPGAEKAEPAPKPAALDEPTEEAAARALDEEDLDAAEPIHIPVRAAPREGALPYPCPDARVTMQKDAATGDLSMRITGCPIGTYSYCPSCPIFVAVGGVRKLVFGG